MALPAGVTTATVTVGVPVTHTGGEVKTFVSIEPSAFLVHAETGTPLVDFLEELQINEGVAGQFTLPHTDQAGFTDESGNSYTNWYYTARVTYSTPSKAKNKAPKVKVFQITTGQTTVDLDKLPGGAPALPYIAPTAKVDAFNGRTGAVELLDTDLPDLSATFATRWKPVTAYTAGQTVVAPDGHVVRAREAFTSTSLFDSSKWEYGTIPGSSNIPVLKPSTDLRAAVYEGTHNSSVGYLHHWLAGAEMGHTAALTAYGVDNDGIGALFANKKLGRGIVIDQKSTITSAAAYGFHATQSSNLAPLMRLEQNVPDAAAALQILAFGGPTDSQHLAYFGDGSGEAGHIRALTGRLEWKRQIVIQDKDGTAGGASYLNVTDNNGVAANVRTHTLIKKQGPEYYGYSGSAGQWWPFAVQVNGSRLKIQGGGLTSTVGTPGSLTNLIEFQNAKIGFFGASPIARPTGVTVDAAGLHAALVSLGLIAA